MIDNILAWIVLGALVIGLLWFLVRTIIGIVEQDEIVIVLATLMASMAIVIAVLLLAYWAIDTVLW